jgi:trans-aconitate 2-methyltransferase
MSDPSSTRAMNSSSREWDAETYDQVSDPQFNWGMEVLERLELRGDEDVVDAGCGSGRVSEQLLARLPDGHLIVVDGSAAMIAKARERLGEGVDYVVADLAELELAKPVDLVFSTATFHWLLDHDNLFGRLRAALRPGGRLVAQCGGEGNVARHAQAIVAAASNHEFGQHFGEANSLWNFAGVEQTERRLRNAGFDKARCWLEPKPVQPADPLTFTMTVTLGPLLAQLPDEKRRPFAEAVLAEAEQPLVLDYVRLNIEAAVPE